MNVNMNINMGLGDKNEEHEVHQEGEGGSEGSQTVSICPNGREVVNLLLSNSITIEDEEEL